MGAMIFYDTPTKAAAVQRVLASFTNSSVIDSKLVGDNLWVIVQYGQIEGENAHHSGKKCIQLFRMVSDSKNWGYGEYHECDALYDYDCPLSFLSKARDYEKDENSVEWRAEVRAFHAGKKAVSSIPLAEGMTIQLNAQGPYTLLSPYRTAGWWLVERKSDGAKFKAKASDIRKAIHASRESSAEVAG